VIAGRFVDVPVGFSPATGDRTWLATARLIVTVGYSVGKRSVRWRHPTFLALGN
jgi:hypothetical protein